MVSPSITCVALYIICRRCQGLIKVTIVSEFKVFFLPKKASLTLSVQCCNLNSLDCSFSIHTRSSNSKDWIMLDFFLQYCEQTDVDL